MKKIAIIKRPVLGTKKLSKKTGLKINNKAFTLVELIVTITILAILGTIGFISFQSYTIYARDVARLSDLNNIKSVLEYTYTESGLYPIPDDAEEVTYSGSTAWYQGNFGEKTRISTKRLNEVPVDPLTGNKYTYSKVKNGNEYELGGVFEGDEVAMKNKPLSQYFPLKEKGVVYADSSDFKAYITGNYNGKVLKVSTGSTDYILAVPSIITTSINNATLEDIITYNSFSIKGTLNLPKSYGGTNKEGNIKKFINPNKYIIFQGNIIKDLGGEDDITAQELITTKLIEAYSGTLTSEKRGDIQNLVDTPIAQKLFVSQNLLKTTVVKNLKITASSGGTGNGGNGGGGATDWRAIDPNCDIPDITIGTQTWAGCNSTIGTGVVYNADNKCYDYQGTNIGGTSCYGYNTKESDYNGTYGVNNIWGKLYTWENAKNTACTTGYHLPSDTEWTTLENYIKGIKGDDNIGWAGHASQNDTNNLVNALKLPLAGYYQGDPMGINIFNYRGNYTYLWSSTSSDPWADTAYVRILDWNNSGINRISGKVVNKNSVRCLKD